MKNELIPSLHLFVPLHDKLTHVINLKIHLDLKVRDKNQVAEIGAFKI